jgi:hypothetical protein
VLRALDEALAFHEHRDRMNGVLHLAEVRWSPLTELLRDGRHEQMEAALCYEEPGHEGDDRGTACGVGVVCAEPGGPDLPTTSTLRLVTCLECLLNLAADEPRPEWLAERNEQKALGVPSTQGRSPGRDLAERLLALVDEADHDPDQGWTDLRTTAFRGLAVALAEQVKRA